MNSDKLFDVEASNQDRAGRSLETSDYYALFAFLVVRSSPRCHYQRLYISTSVGILSLFFILVILHATIVLPHL